VKERGPNRLKIIGSVGLATAIGIGSISQRNTGDPLTYFQKIGNYTAVVLEVSNAVAIGLRSYPNLDPLQLADVTADYLEVVPQLVTNYLNDKQCNSSQLILRPQLHTANVSINRSEAEQISFAERDEKDKFHGLAKDSAERNGLTLINEKQYLEQIDNATTIDEILKAVNSYTRNYSLKISAPDADEIEDLPIKFFGISKNKFDLNKFKSISKDFIKSLYYIPTEVAISANVREIKIVDSTYHIMLKHLLGNSAFYKDLRAEKYGSLHPGGIYHPVNRIIYVGLNELESYKFSGKILHELSHAILFKFCGIFGSLNDKEFAELNPEGFSYASRKSKEKYQGITSTVFGYNNVYEDAAYIMGDFILGFSPERKYSVSPTLVSKIRLLLARTETVTPGYTNYFIDLVNNSNQSS